MYYPMMLKFSYYILLIIYVTLLAGCSRVTSVTSLENHQLEEYEPLDGIWKGEFDIRGRGPYDFTAVHLQDRAYAYSLKAKAMCVGTLSFDGKHILNKYVLFALDGGPFDWANLTGSLEENDAGGKTISTYFKTLNGGDTGALKVSYSRLYNQPSSLEYIQGDWTFTDRDELTSSISINSEGDLTGIDTDGCGFLGNLEVINSKYNVYRTKFEVSECGSVNDEYEGVAFIDEETLVVQIANKKYALFYAFEKSQ